ncbi:DUF2628 domain-containing protein [Paraburkholderia dinghuensis]|uniref:DUF2628 domain-containing protein n=2 Tax=Paraburkholderia dinghuensis TaxID=2305225 RepID=A0A3N6NYA3_9BURK|nr:DUF2628 domain-containing protein [Paraburkholderia dinghuensis]
MSDRLTTSALPSNLKPKWRERFEFFEQYGEPSSPEFKAAYKNLPTGKRLLIGINWVGFFFGPLYLLVLGMWRRTLTWFAIISASVIVEGVFAIATGIDIPDAFDVGISCGLAMLVAITTNYSYYLKTMKGDNGWNPFSGMRWF